MSKQIIIISFHNVVQCIQRVFYLKRENKKKDEEKMNQKMVILIY